MKHFEPKYKKYVFRGWKTYELTEVGKDGILIFKNLIDQSAFSWERWCTKYEESDIKKFIDHWWLRNAPDELRDNYDVAPPSVEEVFSQKMLDMFSRKKLISKQWPIFRDSDERMKTLNGHPDEWWTRSAIDSYHVWGVTVSGDIWSDISLNTKGIALACYPKTKND